MAMARTKTVSYILGTTILADGLAALAWAPAGVIAAVAIVAAFGWFWLKKAPSTAVKAVALVSVCTTLGVTAAQAHAQTVPADATQAAQATAAATPTPEPAAQEWWHRVQFGTTLEGYYQYNANAPFDGVNALRAYDTHADSFSFQQVALVLDAPPDVKQHQPFGVRLDLQFGEATDTLQGNPINEPHPDRYRYIWQAYGSYVIPAGHGVQVDFGKWASNLGYETNYAKDNQAFSRALLFNFLPFYHAGLRATYPVSDKVSLLYAVSNGVQQTEDFNTAKSQEISATLKPTPQVTATLNYFFGQEHIDGNTTRMPNGMFRVLDAYVNYTPTAKLSLALDVNRTTNDPNNTGDTSTPPVPGLTTQALAGVGAYGRYQIAPHVAAGVRYEHLRDDGLFAGIAQTLQEVTVTGEYMLAQGVLLRGEYRRDWSNRPFFNGPDALDPRTGQPTFLLGVIWWMGNKSGTW
jgi:hypothetical protein